MFSFCAFLRAGELTVPTGSSYDPSVHLSVGDIAVDHPSRPSFVRVTIKQSKTDPFRKGVDSFIGRTSTDLCPVAAVLYYLQARGTFPGTIVLFCGRAPPHETAFRRPSARRSPEGEYRPVKVLWTQLQNWSCDDGSGQRDEGLHPGRWESLAYLQYVRLPGSNWRANRVCCHHERTAPYFVSMLDSRYVSCVFKVLVKNRFMGIGKPVASF